MKNSKVNKPKIDDPCLQAANCDDPNCQIQIAGAHEIGIARFWNIITAFYQGDPIPAPLVKSKSDILNLLKGINCSEYRIEYDLDKGNLATQDKMRLIPTPGYNPIPGSGQNPYSIALFKGILLRNPDTFNFYRAVGRDGSNTLAIMALLNGNIVFMGDISDAYPFVNI